MRMPQYEKLPKELQCDEVKHYYDLLKTKTAGLFFKRIFDVTVAIFMIILLLLPMGIIALLIKFTSKGPVIYKQVRVTTFGKQFKIWKFRSMRTDADAKGELLTVGEDDRITSIGKFIRKFRLDELPQIFHVLSGKMTIVGTRPEVPKFTDKYTPEMLATLLLPAGVTSLASIRFKDEAELLADSDDVDKTYIEVILPQKMKYNLEYIENFSFMTDIKLIFKTVAEVFTSQGE